MVGWDDEEDGESEMGPFEVGSETNVSGNEQSNDEEPRIKDVFENLSKTVSRQRASDPLHRVWLLPKIFCFGPHVANTSKKPRNPCNKHRRVSGIHTAAT